MIKFFIKTYIMKILRFTNDSFFSCKFVRFLLATKITWFLHTNLQVINMVNIVKSLGLY